MLEIVEFTTLVRGNVGLPGDFLVVTEEFREDWYFVVSGDSRQVADEIRTPRWRLSRAAPASQRSGVGQTNQDAIASALKLALRRVDACFGVAVVEQIKLTTYPWFVLARIDVSPTRFSKIYFFLRPQTPRLCPRHLQQGAYPCRLSACSKVKAWF
jgi:hypothetical protein